MNKLSKLGVRGEGGDNLDKVKKQHFSQKNALTFVHHWVGETLQCLNKKTAKFVSALRMIAQEKVTTTLFLLNITMGHVWAFPPKNIPESSKISTLLMRCGESRYLSIFGTFLHGQLFNSSVDIDQNVLKQICHGSLFTLILCVQLLRASPKFRNPFFEPKIRNYTKNIWNLQIGRKSGTA